MIEQEAKLGPLTLAQNNVTMACLNLLVVLVHTLTGNGILYLTRE